mgnify:CR=1 FL=1
MSFGKAWVLSCLTAVLLTVVFSLVFGAETVQYIITWIGVGAVLIFYIFFPFWIKGFIDELTGGKSGGEGGN